MPKAIDLTNQRFGKLTAIKKAPSKNSHTYWLCQCDCGNQKEIQTSHLTSGVTTSCGCIGKKGLIKEQEPKACLLCGKIFTPNHYARRYCFECVPKGLDAAATIKRKKHLIKELLVKYKGGKCQICGYCKCQGALQFHHRDPSQKEFSLSQINLNDTNFSLEKIYKEIDKCDLLCANCHAEQHYKED